MRFLQPLPLVDNGAYIPDGPTQRDNDRGRTRHRLQDQKIRARKRLIARKTNPHFISAWREKNSRPVPRAYFNPESKSCWPSMSTEESGDHALRIVGGIKFSTNQDHGLPQELTPIPLHLSYSSRRLSSAADAVSKVGGIPDCAWRCATKVKKSFPSVAVSARGNTIYSRMPLR